MYNFNVGQLVYPDSLRRVISDDQVFSSFKNISGTPKYFHNTLLDVFAKIRLSEVYTFFFTCCAAESHWTEIIQVVTHQYGQRLTDDQVNAKDCSTKVNLIFGKKKCYYCSKIKWLCIQAIMV